MLDLIKRPVRDPQSVVKLRQASMSGPPEAEIALGLALTKCGCCYEAAALLRPHRKHWKDTPRAQEAAFALDAIAWWNKNWRDFARAKQSGNRQAAEALLGDRGGSYWDLPPMLMHLADFAVEDRQLDLAAHLYRRVAYLAERGVPKMPMEAFVYASQTGFVEILLAKGQPEAALREHGRLRPNAGNAAAHEIQHVRLLAASGDDDGAMRALAAMLVTAERRRKGWSAELRKTFAADAPELDRLRARADWSRMIENPGGWAQK